MQVGDQLAQQRDHHDGGGQVVQRRGQEEGDQPHQPQQVHALVSANAVGDDLETFMGIDQLDDGHRAHEEEQNLGNLAEMMTQLLDHMMGVGAGAGGACSEHRQNAVRTENQQRPGDHRREQSGGCLVDF